MSVPSQQPFKDCVCTNHSTDYCLDSRRSFPRAVIGNHPSGLSEDSCRISGPVLFAKTSLSIGCFGSVSSPDWSLSSAMEWCILRLLYLRVKWPNCWTVIEGSLASCL